MDEYIFTENITTFENKHVLFRFFALLAGLTFVLLYVMAQMLSSVFFARRLEEISVEGNSMSPTIENGATVLCTSRVEIDYGSIVVVEADDGSRLVKTVVAMEGDRVERRDGRILIHKMPRSPTAAAGLADLLSFSRKTTYTLVTDFKESFDYIGNVMTVSGGEIFLMGDNYNHSTDSTDAVYKTFRTEQVLYTVIDRKSIFYDRLN